MYVYLIRHGQSTNNVLTDMRLRVKDAPLTDLGHAQAALLAEHLACTPSSEAEPAYGITQLFCSPMIRALQTSRPIAEALGLRPQVWVDLHENGGVYLEEESGEVVGYSGITRAEIAAQFPDYVLPEEVTDQGWWDPAQGRETTGRYGRAIRVALTLRARASSEERIALVMHGGFMSLLLEALSDQLPSATRRKLYHHMNTAITLLDIDSENQVAFHYINRVAHLPPDKRSW